MLKRGYFSDPYSAVTTARIDRRGRFFDRETTIWGQPDELQVYVTARVGGRFKRGGASRTLRMRASVRRMLSGRLVMRCRAPLMTWRVRRDGRLGDSRAR